MIPINEFQASVTDWSPTRQWAYNDSAMKIRCYKVLNSIGRPIALLANGLIHASAAFLLTTTKGIKGLLVGAIQLNPHEMMNSIKLAFYGYVETIMIIGLTLIGLVDYEKMQRMLETNQAGLAIRRSDVSKFSIFYLQSNQISRGWLSIQAELVVKCFSVGIQLTLETAAYLLSTPSSGHSWRQLKTAGSRFIELVNLILASLGTLVLLESNEELKQIINRNP